MKKKSKKGFTLIELVVVIAILGILAAILIPVISGFITRANKAANEANARNLYNSVAMALAVGENLTTKSGTGNTDLPASVRSMFGDIATTTDTWGYVISDGIVVSATYKGKTYTRTP